MKNIKILFLSIFFLISNVAPLNAFAISSLPSFPMQIFGTLKKNGNEMPIGTRIQYYDGTTLIGELGQGTSTLGTIKIGEYGKRGASGGDIGLKNTNPLVIKIMENGMWYQVQNSEITLDASQSDASCPSATSITAVPGINCKYNITIDPPPASLNVPALSSPSTTQIQVVWTKYPESDFQKYQIFRKTGSTGTYSLIKEITDQNITSYTDSGLTSGTSYYYTIKVLDNAGQGAESLPAVASTLTEETSASSTPSTSSGGGGGGGGGGSSCIRPSYTEISPPRNIVVASAEKLTFVASANALQSSLELKINGAKRDITITKKEDGTYLVEADISAEGKTSGEIEVEIFGQSGKDCERATSYVIGIGEAGMVSSGITSGPNISSSSGSEVPYRATSAQENFSDMYASWGTHWAFDYVQVLRDKGILDSAKSTFNPDKEITRAELLKLVIESKFSREEIDSCIEKNGKAESFYPDVDSIAWYGKYICIGHTKGIINGYKDGTMKPNNIVSRAEALKIIIEAEGSGGQNSCLETYIKPDWTYIFFRDVEPIGWYGKYICEAKTKEYTSGYSDGTFKPNKSITRAEAAKFTVEIFEF